MNQIFNFEYVHGNVASSPFFWRTFDIMLAAYNAANVFSILALMIIIVRRISMSSVPCIVNLCTTVYTKLITSCDYLKIITIYKMIEPVICIIFNLEKCL